MFDHLLERWLTPFKAARQRAVFIFTPRSPAQREACLAKLKDSVKAESWLSDGEASHGAPMHRYRDYLGLSHQHVVLDFSQLVHADALAALAGTVKGGGCLWLVMPPTTTAFQDRLLAHAAQFDSIMRVESWSTLLTHLKKETPPSLPVADALPKYPSASQQQVIEAMCKDPDSTHVILADRGRGKSTTLGLALKQAPSVTPILVTGPRPSALTTLLSEAGPQASFRAWDRLLRERPTHRPTLVIDEAAAIPLHCLRALFDHYQVWAVATTVDGYEGCGQGFSLRFLKWLQKRTKVVHHQLHIPLRWAANDPLEEWLNTSLMLDSKPQTGSSEQISAPVQLHFSHASLLNEQELQQTMQLLLEAHYQSSPNDLRLLLDDPAQQLLIARKCQKVVGVTWYASEGPIDDQLQAAVRIGQRRLKGELMPQALGFYRQSTKALNWGWWRITRIAVAASHRRQNLGSQMITAISARGQQQGIDALGTSFGVTEAVLKFWRHTPLQEVRRGLKKNAASGTVSALWALGLKPESKHHLEQLAHLQTLEETWKSGQPIDVDAQHKAALVSLSTTIMRGFIIGALPFIDVRFAWWLLAKVNVELDDQLEKVLEPSTDMSSLLERHQAASRAEFEQQLREQAKSFLTRLDSDPFH